METQVKNGAMILLVAAGLLTGCAKDKDYSSFYKAGQDANVRFSASVPNERLKTPGTINPEQDRYTLLAAGDAHAGGTDNLDKLLGLSRSPGIAALLLAGDITTGHKADYDRVAAMLRNDSLPPCYLVPGNHDLFFDGWSSYLADFGPSTYTVSIKTPGGDDLLVFLDSGSGTLGDKQLAWLKEMFREQRNHFRNCIVVTHCNFFRNQLTESTNPVTEEIGVLLQLFADYRVNLVITGHDHNRSEYDFGGTKYVTLDAIQDGATNASYLEINSVDGIIHYQFKEL